MHFHTFTKENAYTSVALSDATIQKASMQSERVWGPGHDPGLNLYAPPPKPSPLTRTSLLTRPWNVHPLV